MLERLEDVAWEELDGGAVVPDLLRTLASPPASAQRAAMTSLGKALLREDGPAPASAAACPFLIELVADDETSCRDRLMVLLAELAAGGDHRVAFPAPLSGSQPADEGPQAKLHRAVAAGVDAYLDCLSQGTPDERAAAALLLAYLPQHASRTRRIVRAILGGGQLRGAARASALLTLAMLGRRLGTQDDLPLLRRASSDDGAIGLAGLVGAAWLSPKTVGEDEQLELLAHLEADAPPLRELRWWRGHAGWLAAHALREVAAERGDIEVLSLLLDFVPSREAAERIACAWLARFFAPEELEAPDAEPLVRHLRVPAQLTPSQRRLLAELAEQDLATRRVAVTLRWLGLPEKGGELKRLSGVAQAGPLDREHRGDPLWRVAKEVVGGARPATEWTAAMKRLQPDELLALWQDALSPPTWGIDRGWPRSRPDEGYTDAARLLLEALERVPLERLLRRVERPLPGGGWHAQCAAATLAVAIARAHPGPLPHTIDGLIAAALRFEHLPGELRQVVAALPPERRERQLLTLGFGTVRDRRGRIAWRRAWFYADQCPTPGMVAAVVEATQRAAARRAVPVERAVEVLEAFGELARPVVEAALPKARGAARKVLGRVL